MSSSPLAWWAPLREGVLAHMRSAPASVAAAYRSATERLGPVISANPAQFVPVVREYDALMRAWRARLDHIRATQVDTLWSIPSVMTEPAKTAAANRVLKDFVEAEKRWAYYAGGYYSNLRAADPAQPAVGVVPVVAIVVAVGAVVTLAGIAWCSENIAAAKIAAERTRQLESWSAVSREALAAGKDVPPLPDLGPMPTTAGQQANAALARATGALPLMIGGVVAITAAAVLLPLVLKR